MFLTDPDIYKQFPAILIEFYCLQSGLQDVNPLHF